MSLDQICRRVFVTISADPMKRKGLIVRVCNVQAMRFWKAYPAGNGVQGLVPSLVVRSRTNCCLCSRYLSLC